MGLAQRVRHRHRRGDSFEELEQYLLEEFPATASSSGTVSATRPDGASFVGYTPSEFSQETRQRDRTRSEGGMQRTLDVVEAHRNGTNGPEPR